MTKTFEAGKTYSTRSVCDHDCIISVKVVGRTAKTIKTDKGKTFRVYVYEGVERVKPWGSYSMAPIVSVVIDHDMIEAWFRQHMPDTIKINVDGFHALAPQETRT